MKYRVLKFFIDRDTLKEFNAGDLFPCDNPERANELINKCYIERVQDKAPDPDPEKELADDEAPKDEPKKAEKTTKAKGTAKKSASKKKA